VANLARRVPAASRQLQKALELQYPNGKGIARSVASFLASPRSKLAGLQNAITKVRELSLQTVKLKSEIDLLSQANARLQDILTAEERRVDNLLALLQPFQRLPGNPAPRFVQTAPLNDLLPHLVHLAEQGRSGATVLRVLAASVSRVTLAGLAAITGAADADPASIARRLLMDGPAVRAPQWGGRPSADKGMRLQVLPPVDSAILEAIQAQVPALDGDCCVVSADTAHGGVNIVELEVHHPRDIKEIFSQFIKAALNDACLDQAVHAAENDPSLEHTRAWVNEELVVA